MVRTWAIYPKLGYGMVLTWERTQALQDSRSYISRYIRRYQKARGPCQLLEEVRGGEGRWLAVIEEEKVAWLAVLAPLM